jgi:hypothetical protein
MKEQVTPTKGSSEQEAEAKDTFEKEPPEKPPVTPPKHLPRPTRR